MRSGGIHLSLLLATGLLIATAKATAPADGLALWLAAGPACNTCAIFDAAAKAQGYGMTLEHAGHEIPIVPKDKGDLAPAMLTQLPARIAPGSPDWPLQLVIMVVRDDREVLFAGNIAESADLRDLRYDEQVMFPPAQPDDDHPAMGQTAPYAAFFEAQWNLEYFVDVALGRRSPRPPANLVDLQAPSPQMPPARVVLWGSAATPLANAAFLSTRLHQALTVFTTLRPGLSTAILHGHGPTVQGRDESFIRDDTVRFRRATLPRDLAATAGDLNRVLTGVAHTPGAQTLLFQAGHAGPTGAPLWGHGLTLRPEHLAPLKERGTLVMVSGACHGGQFARAVSCGFFAAHPQVTATGCQLSADAIEGSDDYLKLLLEYLGTVRDQAATLHGAHWYASARLEHHQVPYSTSDALVDDFFASGAWPSSITARDLATLAYELPDAERRALTYLLRDLSPQQVVHLDDVVARNHAATASLRDAREVTSAQRNAALSLPYPLTLPLLARRAIHRQHSSEDARFEEVMSCELRPLRAFLDAPPGSARR